MKIAKFIFLLSTFYFLLSTSSVMAAPSAPGVDLTIDLVISRLEFLACWFFRMASTLTLVMLIVYGLIMLFSGGDSSKFQEGKKALAWGIVGAFVVLGVYVIMITVANAVGNTSFSLGFNC